MLSKKLSAEIRVAAEEMNINEMYEFLQKKGVEMREGDVDTVIGFTWHMLSRAQETLKSNNWISYEIRALAALEKVDAGEEDLIWIDAYGFPKKIESNEHLLYISGVSEQMRGGKSA